MPDRLRDGLPDCQLHGLQARANTLVHPVYGDLRRAFCAVCGGDCGFLWGAADHVYAICDACHALRGPLPGAHLIGST